ncbi:MAG TPA: septal ring lytic transglycosylase RlpA family protein [Solirubrobacterales bacterium]|nr:septal ring lytic transglycosylase RlpA family protein [Solirubrobacterales bacterium]
MGMMITAGIAGAQDTVPGLTGSGPEASVASAPTAISLKGQRHVMAHRAVTFRGRVAPGGKHRVMVRVGGHKLRTHSRAGGGYRVTWRSPASGVFTARARVDGSSVRSHRLPVNAYRPAEASYYGPGLYGGGLACGGTLTSGKLGVANKTLPCGSRVTLRYHGHTVTVPVIDRGPYAGNREYDLTAATKAKLGFPSTGTVLTTR